MEARIVLLAVVGILLLGTVSPDAAEDPWEARTRAGEWYFARGDLDRAAVELRAALELAQRLPPRDWRLEISLDNLARLHEHRMEWDRAQPLYLLLLAALEERLGEAHAALLAPLEALARVSLRAGDAPTAEASLERYIALADASGQAPPESLWRVLSLLARVRTLAERHGEALELERRAVAVLDRDPSTDPLTRAAELETLVRLELTAGEPGRAPELMEAAAALRFEAEEPASVAPAYLAAAQVALGAGAGAQADLFARAAMAAGDDPALELAALGVRSDAAWLPVRRTAPSPADLFAAALGDPGVVEARQRLEAELAAVEAAGAPDAGRRAEVLGRLVTTSALLGDAAAAAGWQRLRPGYDSDPSLRGELVALLRAADRDAEAVVENAALIGLLESRWGQDDPRLAPVLERQATLLEELGRKKEARALRKQIRKLSRG